MVNLTPWRARNQQQISHESDVRSRIREVKESGSVWGCPLDFLNHQASPLIRSWSSRVSSSPGSRLPSDFSVSICGLKSPQCLVCVGQPQSWAKLFSHMGGHPDCPSLPFPSPQGLCLPPDVRSVCTPASTGGLPPVRYRST